MTRGDLPFDLATDAAGAAPIARIELGEGDAIFAEIVAGGKRRWIRVEDGRSIELSPWCDRRVPLGRALTPLERARSRVLAYRPERRVVLRVERDDAVTIEKGYRNGRAAAAARAHRCAASVLDGEALLAAPLREEREPTASLVFDVVAGRPLELGPRAADALGLLGRGLRTLQDATPPWLPPAFTAADEIDVVVGWRDRALRLRGELPSGWDEQWSRCARALGDVPAIGRGLAHRDLHDRQLLYHGDALTLLDFDLLCHAEVALDAGNLLSHLSLRRLQRSPGVDAGAVLRMRFAFLAGLDRDAEPGFLRRLACYEASSSLRLALVYFVRPRWASIASELVAHAETCLETCS